MTTCLFSVFLQKVPGVCVVSGHSLFIRRSIIKTADKYR